MNVRSPTPLKPIAVDGFGAQNLYQHREKVFTRFVGGRFQKMRFYTGWPLLFGYFILPWFNWGERQAILFDLSSQQFHLLGLTIWPQDLWLLGWLLMIAAFGLFTVTTVVGRLWCGYTCPQTVWTAIFMWVEQITEGERHQRIRLDKSPLSWNKIRRRGSKHLLWMGWAFFTSITFVGYFTPIRALSLDIVTLDYAAINDWVIFWSVFFSGATYINAGWLREQVCMYMCPYARFQSAMIDKDTLIVSYNPARGEPRGPRKRDEKPEALGDCIDCQLCVQVCPTGIDIRDGLQYECIGCAHCIDACVQVMAKMNYAPNLISYTTDRELRGGGRHLLHGRSIGYAAISVTLVCALVIAVQKRDPFAFDILRARAELYQINRDGSVRNDYQLKIMNKSQQTTTFTIAVNQPSTIELVSIAKISVFPGEIENVILQLCSAQPISSNTAVSITICSLHSGNCVTEETRFLAPLDSNNSSTVQRKEFS